MFALYVLHFVSGVLNFEGSVWSVGVWDGFRLLIVVWVCCFVFVSSCWGCFGVCCLWVLFGFWCIIGL